MSTLAELKHKLEAARVQRERREKETREQEERELQWLVKEEHREEEECACREQQRVDKERTRAEETEAQRKAEEGWVAGEERQKTTETEGGEGSREVDMATGVTETTGESWEADITRLHSAAMAGGSKDGEEEYQATEDTCWNCRHWKQVCERPEYVFSLISLFFFLLIVLQVKEIVLLVHEGKKKVSYDGSWVEETEDGKGGDVGEGEREREGDKDGR